MNSLISAKFYSLHMLKKRCRGLNGNQFLWRSPYYKRRRSSSIRKRTYHKRLNYMMDKLSVARWINSHH